MTLTSTIHLILVGQLGALAIAIVDVSNIIIYNAWAVFCRSYGQLFSCPKPRIGFDEKG